MVDDSLQIDKQLNELKIQLANLHEVKRPADVLVNALFFKIKECKEKGEFWKIAKFEKMIDAVRENNIFLMDSSD